MTLSGSWLTPNDVMTDRFIFGKYGFSPACMPCCCAWGPPPDLPAINLIVHCLGDAK